VALLDNRDTGDSMWEYSYYSNEESLGDVEDTMAEEEQQRDFF
jgi:hypothetical protein